MTPLPSQQMHIAELTATATNLAVAMRAFGLPDPIEIRSWFSDDPEDGLPSGRIDMIFAAGDPTPIRRIGQLFEVSVDEGRLLARCSFVLDGCVVTAGADALPVVGWVAE